MDNPNDTIIAPPFMDEPLQVDYFGFDETHKIVLPDGKSFIEHKELNEGARRKYLNSVNRDITINRASGDAKLRTAPGDERRALLEAAIIGWNLVKNGSPIAFSRQALNEFLDNANPRIVDIIEKDVRQRNPWLLADLTVEDIDKEIENLQTMREARLAEEAGKASS